jgi:hypothetical protein
MSQTTATRNESLPTDPLQALGASLFLNITSYLPFSSLLAVERVSKQWRDLSRERERTIWREACRSTGVDKELRAAFEMTERAPFQPVWSDEPGENPIPSDEPSRAMGWKDICKSHVALDRNWRFGRCRERYLTPPGNSVWRIKVDPESQTLLATDRTGELATLEKARPQADQLGGITVTDCNTSQALFEIGGVRPFAHLEFAKGFVVFDTGNGMSSILGCSLTRI